MQWYSGISSFSDSNHLIWTHIDVVVETIEVYISFPLRSFLMRISYYLGDLVSCLIVHIPPFLYNYHHLVFGIYFYLGT